MNGDSLIFSELTNILVDVSAFIRANTHVCLSVCAHDNLGSKWSQACEAYGTEHTRSQSSWICGTKGLNSSCQIIMCFAYFTREKVRSTSRSIFKNEIVVIKLFSWYFVAWLSAITNDFDVISKSDKTHLSIWMILFHIFDLAKNSFLNCRKSGSRHGSRDVNAINNRNIFSKTIRSHLLCLFLFLLALGKRSSLNYVADSLCFRFFLVIKILKFIKMIAELATPNKLVTIFVDDTKEV